MTMYEKKEGKYNMSKILISMPAEFLTQVDKCAVSEQRSRSELIREALRTYIKRTNMPDAEKSQKNAEILEELIG